MTRAQQAKRDEAMTLTLRYLGERTETAPGEKPWAHFAYEATLTYQGRSYGPIPYKTGTGWVDVKPVTVTWKNLERGDIRYNAFGPGKDGIAVRKPPTVGDVLYSVLTDSNCYDDARDFEDFAESLGYDTDSRRAEGIYRACGETFKAVRALLGADFETVRRLDEGELRAWVKGVTA